MSVPDRMKHLPDKECYQYPWQTARGAASQGVEWITTNVVEPEREPQGADFFGQSWYMKFQLRVRIK
jgi:hypothetical protein